MTRVFLSWAGMPRLGDWRPGDELLSAELMQALWHPYSVSALDGRKIPNIWFEVRS